MKRYSLGVDFGTLSCRAVLVDIDTCEEIISSTADYKHGVISGVFLDGNPLAADFALQHPQDYIDSLIFVIKHCIQNSGVNAADIIGVGVDFTACTLIPVNEKLDPLCFLEEFKNRPHAYAKLWKHHAAQSEADRINRVAKDMSEPWLDCYGGTVSCEWLLPKVMEILHNDEEIFSRTHRFIEAGDWIVSKLTGKESHSLCQAGFKGLYSEGGYPGDEFLAALDERLCGITKSKISANISPLGITAGFISSDMAQITGLKEGTPVSPALIDAHAALPALGVIKPGALLMILGTSSCHILLGDKAICVPGISGYVKDGIYDGLYAYEAGQSAVGDSFSWFIDNCVPKKYYDEAEKIGVGIHKYLREKASEIAPGSGGVMALDWWNGNRTPYVDGGISGAIIGLNLTTKPEAIYRALIEATAFGTRRIVEIYEKQGIEIKDVYAAGGIALKDPLLMQIYADVLGRAISVPKDSETCAYGSAVLGAVGCGFKNLVEASAYMKKEMGVIYTPNSDNKKIYDGFYEKYCELSEYFAKNNRAFMSFLKENGNL